MKKIRTVIADLPASFVVFLVALPLCMGIAIASGVPPALGLITGVVGGIVTGMLSGAPLQVSGPAAGLTVLVFEVVSEFGVAALGPVVFLCGLIQVVAGSARMGQWFRAVSPAVIYGMLSGIGILIITSQVHIAFDAHPGASPLENISLIPNVFAKLTHDPTMAVAGLVAALTLFLMIGWDKFRPDSLKVLPAPLVAIIAASIGAILLGLPIDYVTLPTSLAGSLNIPAAAQWHLLTNSHYLTAAVGLAVIASAETLLCASALKKMKADAEVGYNKELVAQGVGNAICGLLGALPMTGVIVRSTANIGANANTRWSAIFHGIWLLVLVAMFPHILEFIPMAALAAILIYTGLKLINPSVIKSLAAYGRPAVTIYFVTVLGIVFTDLLTGVLIGIGLSTVRLLSLFSNVQIQHTNNEKNSHHLTMKGAATFLTLPKIAQTLEAIPLNHKVSVTFDRVFYIDHACMDLIESQKQQRKTAGGLLDIDSSKLQLSWKKSEAGSISYPSHASAGGLHEEGISLSIPRAPQIQRSPSSDISPWKIKKEVEKPNFKNQ